MSVLSLYRRHIKTRLPGSLRRGISRWYIAAERMYNIVRVRRLATRLLGPRFPRSRELAEIDITYLCNLRCPHCNRSCPQLPSNERMSLAQVARFVEESVAAGVQWRRIRVLGGEPTLHPEFLQIVDLLLQYCRDHSPETLVQVTTNGYGTKVNTQLRRLPLQVSINNTAKDGDPQEQFDTFNIAPVDIPRYAGADFRNGCRILQECGMGVTPFGYYPCAVAGGIDRVFGFDAGRKTLPAADDGMEDLLLRFCPLCGHFKLPDRSATIAAAGMSDTWQQAYRRAQAHPPELSRLREAVSAVPQQLEGWRAKRCRPGGLEDACLVVPTYRRPDQVMALLEILLDRPDVPVEVAVVDGSPDDSLGGRLRRWHERCRPPFDLIYSHGPHGLTRQRNAGIDLTSKPTVFFLDDDAEPLPDYFAAVAKAFTANASAGVGGIGAYVLPQPGGRIPQRWKVRFKLHIVPRLEPLRFGDCGSSVPSVLMQPFSGLREVDILPGCAFACRREILDRERFSTFFDGYSLGEDVEWSLRAGAHCKLGWCGDAQVKHHKAAPGRPPGYVRGVMDVRNRYFLWKRHRAQAHLLDRCRFWADVCLLVLLDLGRALRGPGRRSALAHAAGMARASLGCLIAPPHHEEPPAAREYALKPAV